MESLNNMGVRGADYPHSQKSVYNLNQSSTYMDSQLLIKNIVHLEQCEFEPYWSTYIGDFLSN